VEDDPPKSHSRVGPCTLVRERFSPERAAAAQLKLRQKLVLQDNYPPLRRVAGLDVAYVKVGGVEYGIGVAVALSYPALNVESCVAYVARVCVPYIPGLLAFREMAVLAPALLRLSRRVPLDLVIVDGHGIAHPRGLGIASHVGVAFDVPSIGVAKRRLYGREVEEQGRKLVVDDEGRPIAVVVESGRGSRIYASPGHRVGVFTAGRIVRSMLRKGRRLPEPTRIADSITKSLRRQLQPYPEREGFYEGCSLQ